MKKILYILLGAALLAALTSCEPKFEYTKTAYVVFAETSISVPENLSDLNDNKDVDSLLTIAVKAYPLDGKPNTEVEFEVIDGTGDNAAKNGTDFTIVSPVNNILVFEGDSTAYITVHISNANVGIYTGRKTFTINLTDPTNGYEIGGAYAATVTITDTDKNLDDTIEGIYAVNGGAYYSSGTATDQQWEMQIVQDDTNPDLLYIDGLAPACAGWYASYGSAYCAQGYLSDDETQLIIPSQMLNGITMSGYYVGFGACVEYDDGFYYNPSWPDVTFTKQSDGSWISDYGFFILGCTSNDISTFAVFFDVSIPGLVITKVD